MSAELNMQRVTTLKAEPLTPLAEVEKQLSIATAKAVGAPVLDMKKIKTGKTVTIKEVPERHRRGMKFYPVAYFDEVLKIALSK